MKTKENGLCMHINNIITHGRSFIDIHDLISMKDLLFGYHPIMKARFGLRHFLNDFEVILKY